ncbi:MAG: Do family serine endopeptidase [Burkholderiales bacterium]|nr:Do family serine endopeptidase [Burkholderiales bacterium]
MNSLITRKSLLALGLAAAFGAGYGVLHGVPVAPATAATAPPAAAALPQASSQPAAYPDFAGIVRAYGPAVVNIATSGRSDAQAAPNPNDPMLEFFRRFGPQFPGLPQAPRQQRGQGSGFIVAADGLILTNAHVVDGAAEVTVKLTDRREFRARVVGADKRSDVAVLKIEASGLPTVKLGDPAAVSVGEWVLAIGSPFGFENTATSGIVSAKSRTLEGYVPFIQTDVAVNPGNSGGPLFNLKGEVIGINSQIYSSSGGYQGLSFAIPIDVAVKVRDQLVATGKVTRGRLGVAIQEVNQGLADSFGLPRPQGALVSSVDKGGPADKAGLAAGDIILKVDGRAIDRSGELPALIADIKPGARTRLEVLRNGGMRAIEAVVGEMPEPRVASRG